MARVSFEVGRKFSSGAIVLEPSFVFAVEWNWELRDVFVLIAEPNKELHRFQIILSLKGKLLIIDFIVVMVIKLLYIS